MSALREYNELIKTLIDRLHNLHKIMLQPCSLDKQIELRQDYINTILTIESTIIPLNYELSNLKFKTQKQITGLKQEPVPANTFVNAKGCLL